MTLPAPFFETAYPARWQAALDAVWATLVATRFRATASVFKTRADPHREIREQGVDRQPLLESAHLALQPLRGRRDEVHPLPPRSGGQLRAHQQPVDFVSSLAT